MQESKPLLSFEDNSEYIYDAKWSPIHPALFAAVDGMGRLDLWNLNNDTEVGHFTGFPLLDSYGIYMSGKSRKSWKIF